MSADDNNSASNYAPKSPDLSSFYSAGPTQTLSQLHPPAPPTSTPAAVPPPLQGDSHSRVDYVSPHPSSAAHHYASSYAPSAVAAGPLDVKHGYPGYSPPTQQQQYYLPPSPQQSISPSQALGYDIQSPTSLHQQQGYFPSQSFPSQAGYQPGVHLSQQVPPQIHQLPPQYHQHTPPQQPQQPQQPQRTSPRTAPSAPPHLTALEMPPRRAAAQPPPAIEPSPVKTKFPTARIKRIMQADEEVGKVAQQTPIAVGKALELFMIQMVTKSAEVAKEKGSKRVTAQMLKQVVETDDQWDFLREIVSRVDTEKEGSRAKTKAESESDEEMSEPKKRGRGAGRRKKAAA
ncbi:hypothetical protein HIM_03361 [Hirsutella minnesotensis 3608]|uniref:NCT transcriptional regulatory complex subunit A n=1 Tax=Hirsutella minnesotensis 3608 TaxID=1043627 RepID=A0A0F7ZQD1_9HYPO|nr:hypothetical protein HIM_03361 [Hirsutella minnesotensis 3608]